MPGSKSDSASLLKDVTNDTSDLSEVKIPGEKQCDEKRTVTLIEKNGYHDSIYVNAAKIFQGIHTKKPKDRTLVHYGDESSTPMLTFEEEYSQRVSYELAFSALKYQDILEEILLDSCAYPCQSIPDELTSLLVVMLYDLQDRKFQAREIFDKDQSVAEVQEIERYLYSFKTKLAGALARCRIKHDALSIKSILPENIQRQEQRASALPLFAWVNTFKISDLKKKGFTRVQSESDLDHYTYCMDQHCHDVLMFPSSLKEELLNLDLFTDHKLLLQDKSRSLAAHAAQALLSAGDDLLVAHVGSPLTAAHLSVLTNHSSATIFVCGMKSSAKGEELRNLVSRMGCENLQLLHEDFTEIEPTDKRLEKAKVILLLPQCSGLAVGNPIDFILSEHRDAGLLRDHLRGSVSVDKLSTLAERQLDELRHAMKFKKVQAIVYCTCSVYPEENELVVNKALGSGVEGNEVQPYRLIPSVFSPCSNSKASTDFFFKMEPSEMSSGCFLAVLERQKGPSEGPCVEDVVAGAAAKGLLDGIGGGRAKAEEAEEAEQEAARRRHRIPGAGTQPGSRRAVPSTKDTLPTSRAISNAQRSSGPRASGRAQLKEPVKGGPGTAAPAAPKPPAGTTAPKRTQFKRIPLKPAQIFLPAPYPSFQGHQPPASAQHRSQGVTGAKGSSGRVPAPPLAKGGGPGVLSHPRPWL